MPRSTKECQCPDCNGELVDIKLFGRSSKNFVSGAAIDAEVAYYADADAERLEGILDRVNTRLSGQRGRNPGTIDELERLRLTGEVIRSQILFNDRQPALASDVAAAVVREITERATELVHHAEAWERLRMEATHAQAVALALSGEIELRNVGFCYGTEPGQPDEATRVLSGIDLDVSPGMTVGLVGRLFRFVDGRCTQWPLKGQDKAACKAVLQDNPTRRGGAC